MNHNSSCGTGNHAPTVGADHGWLEKYGEKKKLPEGWKSILLDNDSSGTGDHTPTVGATINQPLDVHALTATAEKFENNEKIR